MRLSLVLAIGALIGACRGTPPADARAARISSFVDARLANESFTPRFDLITRMYERDGVEHFVAEHQFRDQDPRTHLTLVVSVGSAGRLLDPRELERRRARTEASQRAHEFPRIGLRAQRELFGFGPGGAAYGLTFTTCDGRYDVQISLSNRLPAGAPEPAFDLDEFAAAVAARYDRVFVGEEGARACQAR